MSSTSPVSSFLRYRTGRVASYWQLPTVAVSAVLTFHEAHWSSRRIIFAIVLAPSSLTAMLINIVLIASWCYQCCRHPLIIDIVLIALCRFVQLPTVPVSAALTILEARWSSHRIIFAIVLATASNLRAIFIDIVLITSYLIWQTAFVLVTQSYAVYGDVELCWLRWRGR